MDTNMVTILTRLHPVFHGASFIGVLSNQLKEIEPLASVGGDSADEGAWLVQEHWPLVVYIQHRDTDVESFFACNTHK